MIVGSGFSGLAMAQRMKKAGLGDFVVLEKAASVGGTWRENTYPGCACDVPSHVYSFSFALNPEWSSTFSPQPEIKAYIQRTADEHGLTPHVRFGVELTEASWSDAGEQRWNARDLGRADQRPRPDRQRRPAARAEAARRPGPRQLRGRGLPLRASGITPSTSKGKRVAVVGTGASSIQFVPQIQPEVEQMYVFQRTAPWIVPRSDRPITKRRALPLPPRSRRPARDAHRRLLGSRELRDPDAARRGSRRSPAGWRRSTSPARSATPSCAAR